MNVENGMIQLTISNRALERAVSVLRSVQSQFPQAVARAVNRTMDGMRTDAVKETHKKYFVSAKEVRASISFGEATAGNLMGAMVSKGNIFGQEAASGMLAIMRASVDGTLKEYEMLGHEATGIISKMAEMSGGKMEEMRANLKLLEPALGILGLSFQETSIMMAMLAKSGIKNSDATLALTETYRRLTKEPNQVQKALKGQKATQFVQA